jgi:SAM-dependent methyltransferase
MDPEPRAGYAAAPALEYSGGGLERERKKASVDRNHLHALKRYELDSAIAALDDPFSGQVLLEIGSGTGFQLSLLAQRCKSVTGIDLASSTYAGDRLMPVTDYDGAHIPFPDQTFDVIFSSSVLEHIVDLPGFHREMRRVLKNDGVAVHIVPTHVWRLWTALAHYPALPKTILGALRPDLADKRQAAPVRQHRARQHRARQRSPWSKMGAVLFPPRHGEHGNTLSEIFAFRPGRWAAHFEGNGWIVERAVPTGLFQTGYCLFGLGLPVAARAALATVLGSACHTYLVVKDGGLVVKDGACKE